MGKRTRSRSVVSVSALAMVLTVFPFLSAQQPPYADLVLRGGKVITVDGQDRIAEAVAVMELEGTVDHLMFTIHAHPTLSEAMLDGFAAVEGMAINA